MSLSRKLLAATVFAAAIANPAVAAAQSMPSWLTLPATTAPVPDVEYFMPRPVPAWQIELGARYWLGKTTTGKDLYDMPSSSGTEISRLTYSNLTTNTGEAFVRAAFSNGIFIKGYAGLGSLSQGHLRDEDFPSAYLDVYSSTTSDQHNGGIQYASGDLGYDVFRGGDFRAGAFVGYHFLHETMNAFGCTQTAGNAAICGVPIPAQIKAITQVNEWQAVRVGLEGAVKFGGRFTLTAEGAWLPFVHLGGNDTHWLRPDFAGPIPQDAKGQGYQFEAVLSYAVTPRVSLGIGGRYWHMSADGYAQESFTDGSFVSLPVDWKSDIYGGFLQASVRLGPYLLGGLSE